MLKVDHAIVMGLTESCYQLSCMTVRHICLVQECSSVCDQIFLGFIVDGHVCLSLSWHQIFLEYSTLMIFIINQMLHNLFIVLRNSAAGLGAHHC